ncbi:AMP-dependent synthetase and ligase [Paenibacillus curdlanolyticus YK9]|uniref:AMP-dependent synthetase and ligase n=1 Tax=Paenibacillus curdlanolyticus YK9 TaxID=717606 RepID=E0IAZ0_9BACL|nr:AMP-binding protein [Paenibacillus curdlanolyticus]EFM10281.1 AMP-dependent synthetase and ligase [Paenibacillus curdlanolyticus YK9]
MITINREPVQVGSFEARLALLRKSNALRACAGKRLAICLQDPIDMIGAVLIVKEQGASALLLHAETPEATARQRAIDAGCEVLLYGSADGYISLAEQVSGNWSEAAGKLANGWERGPVSAEPSLLQFSSGTTGAPKLIQRAWEEVDAEVKAYNESLGEAANASPIVLAPVSHAYGLISGVLSAFARGKAPIVVTATNPKLTLGIIRDTPEHLVYGVPLLLHVISSLAPQDFRFHRLMSSGAPMTGALLERLSSVSAAVMQQYGCSEAGCISLAAQMQHCGDLGLPLSHMTVTAGRGQAAAEELFVEVAGTGRRIATGDLGYADEQGRLHFMSRLDDVINVGGLNVFPLEVEERLVECNGVKEAVVFRGRHPIMGERALALVTIDAAEQDRLTPSDIRAWCAEGLPPYKVPSEIRIVDAIPRNATGKVSRAMLAREQESEA